MTIVAYTVIGLVLGMALVVVAIAAAVRSVSRAPLSDPYLERIRRSYASQRSWPDGVGAGPQ